MQLKIVPEVDSEGSLTGPLVSGFKFEVKHDGLIPADFDVKTMTLVGTMTLDLKVEKEEPVHEKKHRGKKE